MTIKKYEPLNLYTNFKKSAERYPEMPIHFDEELVTFPELGLHTTYKKCEEAIIQKAAHLHKFGVRKEEKVIVYKSAKFDSYILAVAISYIGAVPIMVSPHLPASTIDIFVNRLDQPWLLFDSETSDKSHQLNNLPDSRLINAEQLFKAPLDGYTCEQEELPKDMIAYMTHTSGTTGVPKLIAHSAN
ncbi:acyl-CoA synthetase, partial [Listeria monocytogenes]|nr:acyl-CoA synthetase [Listeria monocytogenes]